MFRQTSGGFNKRTSLKVIAVFLLCFVSLIFTTSLPASPSEMVYVIPIQATIDPGLAKFVERSYQEAARMQADLVLLEVDSLGGRVDAAIQIGDIIKKSPLPTAALVTGRAISAGAFITIAAPKIAMIPGSSIGDAEPRVGSQKADEKTVSYWAKEMSSTAERNGRDPAIAIAMVDRDAGYPGLAEKGKLLTLSYQEAKKYGYTDYIVQNRAELLSTLGLEGAQMIEARESAAEKLTRIVTNPYVAPLLLTIGIAGIIIEFFTLGWGIAGSLGVLSLILYFWGHMLAGFTGWEVLLLFLLGLILLVVEAVVPGFGLPGIAGIISIMASIVMAAPNWEAGIISLVLAIVGTFILVMLSFKFLTKRRFWSRLILGTKYKKEEGYIPQTQDLTIYIGQKGVVMTTLRPAGTVLLDDGTRLDVVTEGEFISRNERVEIVHVEGGRIIARRTTQEQKE